jgi:RimJ/RimL family protein N-acetyltransferase
VETSPITLEGRHVWLEPLTQAHAESLVSAAGDGELWKSTVTVVPSRDTVADYIRAALDGQAQGRELPFVIIRKPLECADLAIPTGQDRTPNYDVVGTTRFYEISLVDRRAAIGYTWLAASAQRTPINTECKLLLLTHAFESWNCFRVELITDVLNEQSRAAILRLGAKQEGILRKHLILPSGRIRDSVVFSVIDEEWLEVKARLMARLAQGN